jgi:hypothetical protein
MPFQLDDYDVSILKSLLKDGRKSFREVSRETGITTPTVKARFIRLVNVGFIKSISPILNFNVVERENISKPEHKKEQNSPNKDSTQQKNESEKPNLIKRGLKIKLNCEFCKGPISAHPYIFKFANFERFFCCAVCMSGYKQKYAGRIESIKRKFEGKE